MTARKRSLLGELFVLRPAGTAGTAAAISFFGDLRSPWPPSFRAASGGVERPATRRRG